MRKRRSHKRRNLIIIGVIIVLAALGIGAWLLAKPVTQTGPSATSTSTGSSQESALVCTEALPIATQIGQKLMFGGYSDQIAGEQSELQQANIGGVIIMTETPGATISAMVSGFAIAPFVATDQEGGTVQRYTSEGLLPGADQMPNYSAESAYQQYFTDDQYLKSVGITTNFAPVVDVLSVNPSPLPGRMYSTDPAVVVTYATQAIKAAEAAGITPVIKHFPGLGSASGNTDDESATTDPLSVLETRDLIPYHQLAGLNPDVMVSNAIVPGLTDGQPASLSSAAVALLRTMYPNAVVYSDSLTANAVPGNLDDAVVAAWKAGIDVALIAQKHDEISQIPGDITAITSDAENALQSGALNKKSFAQSVLRILQRKHIDPCGLS